jgi:hypothetical protein
VTVRKGLPPWHLWGATFTADCSVAAGSPIGAGQLSSQLARIDYARPDTFSFFFAATLTAMSAGSLTVAFDLTLGLGRSSFTIPAFELFTFVPGDLGTTKFSTSINGPKRSVADVGQNVIAELAAQSINCTARVTIGNGGAAASGSVITSASFAPRSHIRPEWFLKHFPGGEEAGS